MTSAAPESTEVQAVHRYFRGSGELAKIFHGASFAAELAMTLLAVQGLVSDRALHRDWRPLVILALAAGSVAFRILASRAESFSQLCRRASLRAFALDREIERRLLLEIEDQVPTFTERFARKLPGNSLKDYYEPASTPGEARLRELYAHSAFYNWQLQRLHAGLTGAVGVLLLVLGFVFTYTLLVRPPDSGAPVEVLDGFYTVVLSLIALRALLRSSNALITANSMKGVVQILLHSSPKGDALQDVILHYEAERARAPLIPTWLYRVLRGRLQKKWHQARAVLGSA